jgi:PAS domain S-box-containing protein
MDFAKAHGLWEKIQFRTKVVIISIIMITFVITLSATYFIRTQTELLKSELGKRSVALVENLAHNSDSPLLLEDVAAIDKLVSALMKDEDVSFVDVQNAEGQVLLRAKKEDISPGHIDVGLNNLGGGIMAEQAHIEKDGFLFISRQVRSPVEQGFSVDGLSPERNSMNPVGQIIAGISLKKTNDLITRSIVLTIILALAITLISVLLAVVMADRFINPLLLLVKGTKELSAGNLSHRVDIRRTDEIGELAGAFNNMAESIEGSRRRLEEYSQTLEEKVQERTADIERRNERIIKYQRVLLELARQPHEDISSSFKMIVEASATALNVERAGIWQFNGDRSELICEDLYVLRSGSHEKGDHRPVVKYSRYFKALEERGTISAEDARHDLRTSEMTEDYLIPFDIASILATPIHFQGEIVGVLCFEQTGNLRHWTLEEEEFATSVATRISLVVEASRRQQTEQALVESEARYRTIFEATGTAMAIVEHDGSISLVNTEFEKMFGFTQKELEGRKDWTGFIFTEDANTMDVNRNLCQNSPTASASHYELMAVNKQGHQKDVFITASIMPGTHRRVYSLIDISEKKRLENELHQAQKMEAVGTLAGGIAHDFNNLLMGIQGYASLMLFNLDAGHPHHEKLTRVEEHVQSGAELTRQLLGFARGGKYEIKPTDVNDILEKTSNMFGRTKKEITIEKRYQDGIWTVDMDRGQIEQVFLNLYLNAWQAMPGGGILYLESANIHLDVEYAKTFHVTPGAHVKVSVTDTGVGMDAKTRERIFEPFFTTKEMGRGTGLGLATVYGIIKGHNGIINVYSEKGMGTSFHIYLPASDNEVLRDVLLLNDLEKGCETILCVDDEKPILDVSQGLLETLGYRVLVANNGQEAVEIYKSQMNAIDLVILDMIMPGLGGGETFDIIRSMNPEVRVILSSGYSLDGAAEKIMKRGCRSFIQKPFTMYHLSKKIREVLA